MWESPIKVVEEIQDAFIDDFRTKTEEMIFTEIKKIGIDIDKEELLKALQYDRNQYEKGYSDGYADAIDEFAERLKSDEFQKYNLDMVFETSRDLSYSNCVNSFCEYIDEIAEQMKGGE